MPDSVRYKMFINGIWQDASDGKRFDSITRQQNSHGAAYPNRPRMISTGRLNRPMQHLHLGHGRV